MSFPSRGISLFRLQMKLRIGRDCMHHPNAHVPELSTHRHVSRAASIDGPATTALTVRQCLQCGPVLPSESSLAAFLLIRVGLPRRWLARRLPSASACLAGGPMVQRPPRRPAAEQRRPLCPIGRCHGAGVLGIAPPPPRAKGVRRLPRDYLLHGRVG